jgi:L-alanine-DL-glutamate epimerase-like enolase superfamily enzyme
MRTLPVDLVETRRVRLPMRKDFRWNGLERPLGEVLIVRVASGDHEGFGESVPLPDWGGASGSPYGETVSVDQAVIHEQIAPFVLGRDAVALPEILSAARRGIIGYPYALAALDIALHDLVARAVGVPAHLLLGGLRNHSVPIAHMIGLMPQTAALKEASRSLEEGCRAFQVKGGPDAGRDVALVQSLRQLCGSGVTLRVDANCGYGSPKKALDVVKALGDAGADMVEQPVGGRGELGIVSRGSPLLIMADEDCWSPKDAVALAANGFADAISVYVAKSGGMAAASAVATVAAAAGLPHDLNGSLETGIGNAASLHVAAASGAEVLASVLPISAPASMEPTKVFGRYFSDDLVESPMKLVDGSIEVPDTPGLGFTVDRDKLDHYTADRRESRLGARRGEQTEAGDQ